MFDYSRLPEQNRAGAKLWIENGILPGEFLVAVISNNLKETFMRADEENIRRMFDVVSFWYNEAPSQCWGSADKVARWQAVGGLKGINRTNEKTIGNPPVNLKLVKEQTP